MILIKELSYFEYLFNFTLQLPPLGVYSVRHNLTNEGVLLAAFDNERPIGIAVLEFTLRPRLTYLFVEAEYRGLGTGTQLIHQALSVAKSRAATGLEACVVLENEYGETTAHVLRKAGFEESNPATIIRYGNDEKCSRTWSLFKEERGDRIRRALVRRGYKTLPFSEISLETFAKMKGAVGREFPANLDPFKFIDNTNDCLVPEYSFMTLKGDEPVAFVIVTTVDDKTLVFQQLSTAFQHQGSGIFLLPFAAFMDKFLTGETYTKVSAVVLGKNDRMQRLVNGFIGTLAESIKTQMSYRCKL